MLRCKNKCAAHLAKLSVSCNMSSDILQKLEDNPYLPLVATKLRKGDIGLPFVRPPVRPSVRPFALNNFKTFGRILMISHTAL